MATAQHVERGREDVAAGRVVSQDEVEQPLVKQRSVD